MSLRVRRGVCVLLFSLLLFSLPSPALEAGRGAPYIHTAWQTDEGLPQNSVTAIVQTRDGYLWLATQEGLARFDGMRFTVFDKRNTPALAENNIQALYEQRDGTLWVGTEGGGVVRLKDHRFTTYGMAEGLGGNIVDAICEDREGNLWVGTLAGLSRFDGNHFTTYTSNDGLPKETVLALCADRQGRLWVGTEDGGLCRFERGQLTTFTVKDGLADNLVRSIYEDRAGDLWVGTRSGLSRLRDGRFATYTTKNGLANDSVWATLEDHEGNLWVGTSGGLMRWRDGQFQPAPSDDGLTGMTVASLAEDREGNLWVGTQEGGLVRLKPGRFATVTRRDGLAADLVRPILEDYRGDLWIGTAKGLCRWHDGQVTTYTKKEGLITDLIVALAEDRAGNLWVGTSGGLNRLRDGRFSAFTTKDGLSDNNVLSLAEGRDGSLWVGTASGLSRLKDGKLTAFTTKDGLTNDSIWSLDVDDAGDVWIGTDGGGLNRFHDGRFSALTTRDGLANDIVLSLHGDQEGSLWVGTSGGLSHLKAGRLVSYTTKDGLFDDVIFQILDDGLGYLWMSCNKGVFRVSKAQLIDFEGGGPPLDSISYGTADGMKSRECNGGFQPAGWRTRDGRLWFPTIKGVAVIAPARLAVNAQPPPVVIERVLVDDEALAPTDRAELPPGRRKLEFHYTALSFTAPEKVRFKYRLEGFDPDWVDAGARREASYTNIPPGRYHFTVIACNNDGVWNEAGTSFAFRLAPRFYQTVWFYALCLAVVGLIALTLYRLRVRQMRAQFAAVLAERSRLAREIHDTLAQGFAGISLQLESVAETMGAVPDEARLHLDSARRLARSSLAEARRSVWQLRSPALEGGLGAALQAAAQQLTAAGRARVRVQTHGAPRPLDTLVESNLLYIGREAISNAVRHAGAAMIAVELSYAGDRVWLRVSDDGCGFDVAAHAAGGFGLIGMRERAEQIGGRLTIDSRQGKGTDVVIEVSG